MITNSETQQQHNYYYTNRRVSQPIMITNQQRDRDMVVAVLITCPLEPQIVYVVEHVCKIRSSM